MILKFTNAVFFHIIVETGKWDVSAFGKYRLYRGQLTGELLDGFGTAFAQATAEKVYMNVYTMKFEIRE